MTADQVVALVGHVAWPVTLLVVLVIFRDQARKVVKAITDKIGNPDTNVGIGPQGLEVTANIEAIKARVGTLEVAQDQQSSLIVSQVRSGSAIKAEGVPEELLAMAQNFLNIDIANWRKRVQTKTAASNEMGVYIIKHDVSRDLLVEQRNEGLASGLAAAIILDPDPKDADRLLAVSS